MKRLFRYLKNYRVQCVLAPLFKMLEATFELFVPLVIASLIDYISAPSSAGTGSGFIFRSFALLIALGIVGLISSCTAQFFAARAATGFSRELRHDLFKSLLSLDHSQIDNLGTSTMITRMTADVNTAQNGVNMFLRLFLRSPFIVAGAVIMAFTIDTRSALAFLIVVAILFAAVGLIMKLNIPMLRKVQSHLDRILRFTRENLSGARVIRAFTVEEDRQKVFENANSELVSGQIRAGRISGLLNPLTYVIINLAIVVLIRTGYIQVSRGMLTTGQVVALYNYMSQILLELIKFANLVVTINRALASADRISAVFALADGESDERAGTGNDSLIDQVNATGISGGRTLDTENTEGCSVEFKDVCLRYHKEADESLSHISFKAEAGETIGIIGGTGSGKTSLVNLIPGFYEATEGEVLIDGIRVDDLDGRSLKAAVGTVPQKAVLFAGTIADNLRWGKADATDAEIMDAVRVAVAEDVVDAKGGLNAELEAGGRNLSGGQRQRLTIARALVGSPRILILDDSSSALDNVTDRKLRDNLKNLGYKPTVFIVSQRSASVRDADKIIVLDDGEVAGIGTHAELMTTCDVYREIYESQFGKEEEHGA
ncbi:ABC-type multidrug transport system, ATPase and permease component [Lachnospiraceae bacterium XBB2008]|nr:ABC-type multidrug transport system, ATPase and permease component [Lachnospiraceae bacterium XBB2008]